jgi:DNA polymerase-3 subunit beta
MKIQILAQEILPSLKTVISIVENKSLPILSHILIQIQNKTLTLTTTNLEIEIETKTPIQSDKTITFTLHAKDLIDIINGLNPETSIEFIIEEQTENTNASVYIKINNNLFELNTLNHTEFKKFSKLNNPNLIEIELETFKNFISNTGFSMGNQDIRAYLNGLYLEFNPQEITVVATDGHRLSIGTTQQQNKLENKKSIIIPRKTITTISKLFNETTSTNKIINCCINDSLFQITLGEVTITSRLIDGNFPNYQQVVPNIFDNEIFINRINFLNSLRQSSVFIEKQKAVKLTFNDSTLNIFSHSERGQAKIQIDIENFTGKIETAFNIDYLINILKNLNEEKILMVISNDEKQSCLLANYENRTYNHIVMPMKI